MDPIFVVPIKKLQYMLIWILFGYCSFACKLRKNNQYSTVTFTTTTFGIFRF